MPVISMFYGLIIKMFYEDNKQHKLPHIHVNYNEIQCCIFNSSWKFIKRFVTFEQAKTSTSLDRNT